MCSRPCTRHCKWINLWSTRSVSFQLCHIDYGHIIGNFKTFDLKGLKLFTREPSPFRLTPDFVYLLRRGPKNSNEHFEKLVYVQTFFLLCCVHILYVIAADCDLGCWFWYACKCIYKLNFFEQYLQMEELTWWYASYLRERLWLYMYTDLLSFLCKFQIQNFVWTRLHHTTPRT